MLRNGRAGANNGSDGEIAEALANAAFSHPQLQMVAYRLNSFAVQMAGARRLARAESSPRRFFSVFPQIPRVVFPALDIDASNFMGSIERGPDSDEEIRSDEETQSEQDQMERQNKKAKKEAAVEDGRQM